MAKATPSKANVSAPEADLAAVDTAQRATLEKNFKDSRSAFIVGKQRKTGQTSNSIRPLAGWPNLPPPWETITRP